MNVVIGRDGLRPRRKRKTTAKPRTAPAPAPAPQIQQTYMSPIYIPPTPVPIIRQRIRNQADIQEQLRAYDQQQQDLVGANAASFEATNLDKRVLYPMKLKREDDPAFFDAPEPMAAEEKTEPVGTKRPRVAQEVGREEAQRMFGAEAVAPEPAPTAEARFAFGTPVPARVMGAVGRPKGSGNKKKTKEELKAEIAASGSIPDNFKDMKLPEVVILARERGISLMR